MLRLPGAEVHFLRRVDPPLGVQPAMRAQHTLEFAPGSVLVLYTDGLIERPTESIDVGLDRLAAAIKGGPVHDPDLLCASLFDRCMGDSPRQDDAAIMCAVIDPEHSRSAGG